MTPRNKCLLNVSATVPTLWLSALLFAAPATQVQAAIQDRREPIAQESERYRTQHFADGHMPPKHDWSRQRPVRRGQTGPEEVPGGIGYGYYFPDGALLWTNSTIADYYVIAPTVLGGSVYTLYLTSTCRAQLGTESLIEYFAENEAQFWIYDWARPATNRWQVMIDLPTAHPQYLTTRPDEFGNNRQMCHIRNGTFFMGLVGARYNWQNQVMLFDFKRGDWDLMYSYDYSTTNLSDNTFTGGDGFGWWGPIVETFDTYTNVNPVGFDLIRLFQDGNPSSLWLTPNNSWASHSSPWNLLTEAPNTSFTVSVGTTNQSSGPYNRGSLCVSVNTSAASFSLNPPAGLISSNWVIRPNGNLWDKTVVGLPAGTYSVTFNDAPGLITPTPQTFTIMTNTITTVQADYGTATPLFTTVRTFTGVNGASPYAGLVQGTNGYFYGTTFLGGDHGFGTVFQMNVIGDLTSLVSFTGTNGAFLGAYPWAGLIQSDDGSFYGTTYGGGLLSAGGNFNSDGLGTAFKMTSDGALTTLGSLAGTNGVSPIAGLVRGMDGNFYGTAATGGASQSGAVFKMNTNGSIRALFSFNGTNGAVPYGALLQHPDGSLFGTTYFGGTSNWGTVFKITTNGTLTTLVSFSGTNGCNPQAGLASAADGNFYGSTEYGGAHGHGTIFRMTADGAFTTLVSFTGTNGAYLGSHPFAALVQATDGNFYGTTHLGGLYGYGTVFVMTPEGALTTLVSFTGTNGAYLGAYPLGSLVQSYDGRFHGTTYSGGNASVGFPSGAGTIFRLDIPAATSPKIQSVRKSGSTFTLTWSALATRQYQVQFLNDLTQTNWTDLGSVITATNAIMSASDTIGADPQRFYRVVLLPFDTIGQ